MRFFTYDCTNDACKHEQDEMVSSLSPPPETVDCEKCGSKAARRLVYAQPGVRLPNGTATYSRGF